MVSTVLFSNISGYGPISLQFLAVSFFSSRSLCTVWQTVSSICIYISSLHRWSCSKQRPTTLESQCESWEIMNDYAGQVCVFCSTDCLDGQVTGSWCRPESTQCVWTRTGSPTCCVSIRYITFGGSARWASCSEVCCRLQCTGTWMLGLHRLRQSKVGWGA